MEKLKGRIDQKELRKLMAERKLNNQKANAEKIESPLAKYDGQGNLTCIICRSIIKSATVWKVHINSKQHKHNVEEARLLKTQILQSAKIGNTTKSCINTTTKIPAKTSTDVVQVKTPSTNAVATGKVTEYIKPEPKSKPVEEARPNNENAVKKNENTTMDSVLPEAFFDEPVNKNDMKELQDEEWERFQREIKEETMASNIIIAGEQSEATVDRQIEEIDEQIQHWSKVLDFEEKIENLHKTHKSKRTVSESSDSNSDSDDILDDFLLNWRSKSLK